MSVKIVKLKAQSAKRKVQAQNFPAMAGSHQSRNIRREKFLVLNFSFALFVLRFTLPCYAAPCYGTRMPEKKEFIVGVQTHSIFKRYLENEQGRLRSTQHFLLLSYGIYDWLSLDSKVGAGNIKQHPSGNDEVDYPSSFSGGYGFRLKLYDQQKIKMVFGFQHISVHPKGVHLGDTEDRAILDDWQSSFLISRDFLKFTPYLGTRWSRLDYIHRRGDNRKRVMSDLTKSIGLICGIDIPIGKKAWVNLEGQLIDSQALSFSLNYNF